MNNCTLRSNINTDSLSFICPKAIACKTALNRLSVLSDEIGDRSVKLRIAVCDSRDFRWLYC
jgi:hypothetical protein